MMAVVVLPLLLPILPVGALDADPRVGGAAMQSGGAIGWGPRGAAWVQLAAAALSLIGAGLALRHGVRLHRVATGLAGLGLLWTVGHLTLGAVAWDDWRQGGAWAGAVVTAWGVLHLGQIPGARRWMAAVLVGVLVPVAADAVWETQVEHRWNLEHYEANRDDVLARQGIEPGSEQQQLYERRMNFNDATGNLGLSNVLASLTGALAALAAGVSLGLWRRRTGEGDANRLPVILAAAAAGGGLLTVASTHSTGGTLGLLAGAGLGAAALILIRWAGRHAAWLVPAAAVGLVVLAFAAVLVRGAMGVQAPPPPGAGPEALGERSLLFRYQYWSAGARLWAEAPLTGVGPTGIADGYPRLKDPLNPETVSSLHNVFVDLAVTLGVGGLAWGALLMMWLWRAGRAVGGPLMEPSAGEPPLAGRAGTWLAGAVVAGAYLLALPALQPGLVPESALLMIAAGLGWWAVTATIGNAPHLPPCTLQVGLLAAAAVLLVHNQIEMTFFQTSSCTLAWSVMALAASGSAPPPPPVELLGRTPPRRRPAVYTAVAAVILLAMLVHAWRVDRHQRLAAQVAASLRIGNTEATLDALQAMQHAAGFDDRALSWRVRLLALEPLMSDPTRLNPARARTALDRAVALIDAALTDGYQTPGVHRLRANLHAAAAQRLDDEALLREAIDAYRTLQSLSPHNIPDQLALGDLLAEAGRDREAADAYRRVLQLRDEKYLDPAEPLRAADLQRIERFVPDRPADAPPLP